MVTNSTLNDPQAVNYTYELDKWSRLERFLKLGTEGGTFYAEQEALTADNLKAVAACLAENGPRTIQFAAEISDSGKSLKTDAPLMVASMGMASADPETRKLVEQNFNKFVRIPTHLFHFVEYVSKQRGWGRSLVRLIRNYYLKTPASKLAFHAIKYQQRDGWSHRDLLRLSHPKVEAGSEHEAIFAWMNGQPREVSEAYLAKLSYADRYALGKRRETAKLYWDKFTGSHPEALPESLRQIWAFEQVKRPVSDSEVIKLIQDYRLPRECVPTEKQTKSVWDAILPNLGLEALVRNLGNLSKNGVFDNPNNVKSVVERLGNFEALKQARLHPVKILSALAVYSEGRGIRGSGEWEVNKPIVGALEEAFYRSFGVLEPAGVRFRVGIDVSASMSTSLAKIAGLSCSKAAAAMALTLHRTEPSVELYAFHNGLSRVKVDERSKLGDIFTQIDSINGGGTNISLPIQDALMKKVPVDCFVVITDNECNSGARPADLLRKYRAEMKIPAKLIVLAMTATGFTIADPSDRGMLDIAGMSQDVPQLVTDFAAGRI